MPNRYVLDKANVTYLTVIDSMMTDSRRLTTDRFYGGTSRRIGLLRRFLSFVNDETAEQSEAKDWIMSNTQARSLDAVDRHLGFLDAIELIDLTDNTVSLNDRGKQYLNTSDPSVLYEALRSNVKGFDVILQQIADGPMTDEDIMDLLVAKFEDINMNSPGVAARHREWLQVLGYIERSDGVNSLTDEGRELFAQITSSTGSMTDADRLSELRSRLLQSEMACISTGEQDLIDDIYPAVKASYPNLCNDSYRCEEAHESGRDQPEWKHAVRDIQQRIADREWGRVRRLDERGKWLYLPRFDPGEIYRRSNLHDQFGGQRQRGISPCRDVPIILLFTSFSETDEGYRNTIADDGTVIYTGEGTEGDMTFDHGNKAIRDHRDDRRELCLFETIGDGRVRYVNQYECVDWFREELPDSTGGMRDAIRFELSPVDSTGISHSDGLESDVRASNSDSDIITGDDIELPDGSETTERRPTTGSDIIRNEELVRKLKALYNHTCQICGDRRLKGTSTGFSHVHHLMPLGEPHSGPDIPENTVVVCPNHHEDFENGMLAIDPQTLEVNHFYEETLRGKTVETKEGHQIGPQYVAYHNQVQVPVED